MKIPPLLRGLKVDVDIVYVIILFTASILLYMEKFYFTASIVLLYTGYLIEEYLCIKIEDWLGFKRARKACKILTYVEKLLDVAEIIYSIVLTLLVITQLITRGSLGVDLVLTIVIVILVRSL